jgi:transcriptional regulator with XRE-family HTH domain
MSFGKRLQEFRKSRHTSQRTLVELMCIDPAYLSRIENDRNGHTPNRETIERLAKVLKLTTEESDELHVLASKMPADIDRALFSNPKLMCMVRKEIDRQ